MILFESHMQTTWYCALKVISNKNQKFIFEKYFEILAILKLKLCWIKSEIEQKWILQLE